MMEDIEIYAEGLCYMSVCAKNGITVEAIVEEMNRRRPTGIHSPWVLSDDKNFRLGKANPCPCDREPDGRMHYLLSC